MKKFKKLNEVLCRYNGLSARYAKHKTKENEAMLLDAFNDVKEEANKILGEHDKA